MKFDVSNSTKEIDLELIIFEDGTGFNNPSKLMSHKLLPTFGLSLTDDYKDNGVEALLFLTDQNQSNLIKKFPESNPFGVISFVGPNGEIKLIPLYSGDLIEGKLKTTIIIDNNLAPGSWKFGGFRLKDSAGNTSNSPFEINDSFGSGVILNNDTYTDNTAKINLLNFSKFSNINPKNLVFEVVNNTYLTTEDNTPPIIKDIRLSHNAINLNEGEKILSIEIDVEDENLVGIFGNTTGLYTKHLELKENVISSANDIKAFVIMQNLSHKLAKSSGDSDYSSGSIYIGLTAEKSESQNITKLKGQIKIDENFNDGLWAITDIEISDKFQNGSSPDLGLDNLNFYNDSNLQSLYIDSFAERLGVDKSNISFNIIKASTDGNTSDTIPPKILDIRFSENLINLNSGEQRLHIEVDIKDIGFGIQKPYKLSNSINQLSNSDAFGYLTIIGPDGKCGEILLSANQLIAGNKNEGTYKTFIDLPDYLSPGKWRINDVHILDSSGNQFNTSITKNYYESSYKTYSAPDKNVLEDRTEELAKQLGISPSKLIFNIENDNYKNQIDTTQPDLLGIKLLESNPENNGAASFSIAGSTKEGQILTINKSSTDPDGDDGNYNYQWQLSSDGINWQDIGDNNSTYTIRALDLGNKIRAQISYTDNKGFKETVGTDTRTIPVPVTVNNVETFGSYTLAKNDNGDGYIAPAGTEDFTPLTDKDGNSMGDKSYPGWSLIGADTVEGINRTAWKHDNYGFFFHKHDANWKEIPGGSSENVGSTAFYNLETSFAQDLDGDGFTGAAPKNNGKASFSVTGSTKEGQILTINKSSTDPDGDDGNYNYQWQLSSDGINWQDIGDNNSTYTLRTLDLGNKIRAQISYTDNKGFKEQVTTDIRNIPVPVTVTNVETFGSYTLAKNNDGDGYIAPAGTEDFTLITDKDGKPLGDKSYPGWSLIGADTVDGINRTAWKHDVYGFFFHKHDANWKEIPGGSVEPVGSASFYNLETSFAQDLDGDGFTGAAPKNDGTASFSVTGSTKEGQILTINRSSTDPDGDDGNYNYQWQLSSDGINWQDIGDNNSTYTLRTLDLGNKIRAQISYTDNKGFKEQVTTDIRNIPVPVTVTNVETFGSYTLAKNNDGDGYIAPAGTEDFTLITDKNGKPLGDKSYPGWSLIGADTVDGINRTAYGNIITTVSSSINMTPTGRKFQVGL